jgi:rhodanese-related sulfurtransferase
MHMFSRRLILSTLAVSVLSLGTLSLAAPAHAADKPTQPALQVKSDLYVTPTEAWTLLQNDPSVLLVDVRDPSEMMFTGSTPETDIHVPLAWVNATALNPKSGTLAMDRNPTFADQVEAKLAALGADKSKSKIIFMCRSGSRSAMAANALYERGWQQAYTMVGGFEGSPRADGPSKGVRDVDGWRNSGLPWGYKLPAAAMTLAPAQ